MDNLRQTCIWLQPEVLDALKALAKARGVSIRELVTHIIKQYFQQNKV